MTDAGEFLIHSRAAAGAGEPDRELTEEHWRYMDGFAGSMVARGPTLAADRETWTGSVHIVGLPGADAARRFAEREPYNRAGLFERHLIRRFADRLGRSMWEFPGTSDEPRFMVIAHGAATAGRTAPPVGDDRLIIHGDLLTPVEGAPAGVVWALQAPTRQAVHDLLRAARLDRDGDVEIHDWEFGGRR